MSPTSRAADVARSPADRPIASRRRSGPGATQDDSDSGPAAAHARGRRGRRDPALDDYASRVLDVVDAIPPGRVLSYGDVAEVLGDGGPRQVGRVMALWGGGVAWWRVVHADGSLLAGHERAALARYADENTPLRQPAGGGQPRIDMRRARSGR